MNPGNTSCITAADIDLNVLANNHVLDWVYGDFLNDYEGIGGHEGYRPELALMYLPEIDPASGVLRKLRIIPFRIKKFRLNYAGSEDAAWLEERLDRECKKFGAGIRRIAGRGI
jgi:poly-gamma-glutamate synthesis protein (capsule biosynthesis protein)